jgi:hypothetical protein
MSKRGQTTMQTLEGWGSAYRAAEIAGVSHMTIRRAAEADEIRSRRLKSRLLIWLPDLVPAPRGEPPKPVEEPRRKRGRPKISERRK